jgi:hypothetical protein
VPDNVGECFILKGFTGKWTVANNKSGKDHVFIPCKTRSEALAICERLNTGDHNGQISIPKHG